MERADSGEDFSHKEYYKGKVPLWIHQCVWIGRRQLMTMTAGDTDGRGEWKYGWDSLQISRPKCHRAVVKCWTNLSLLYERITMTNRYWFDRIPKGKDFTCLQKSTSPPSLTTRSNSFSNGSGNAPFSKSSTKRKNERRYKKKKSEK